jgi:hypothetical protein
MSFLSAQGQTNTTAFQYPVGAGGGASASLDNLITINAGELPSGYYLVSFLTTIGGGAITSGYINFIKDGIGNFGVIEFTVAGIYYITAPVYLQTTDSITVNASATGGAWTSSAGTLYLIRMP